MTKYPISKVTKFCGNQPVSILGSLSLASSTPQDKGYALQCCIDEGSIYPQFHRRVDGASIQLIIFDRPDPHRMQYFALQPVPFERIAHREPKVAANGYPLMVNDLPNIFGNYSATHDQSLTQLHINQMNCAREIAAVLQKNLPKLHSRRNRNRSQSFHEAVTSSRIELLVYFWASIVDLYQRVSQEIRPRRDRALSSFVKAQLLVIDGFLWALNTPIFGTLALEEVSVTARELEFRIQKLKSWPTEYLTLRERKKDWASITNYHPDYIKFYNGMWLIANDLIFGFYLVVICLNNEEALAEAVFSAVNKYSIDTVAEMMLWLKGWPAGLKLNSELASFFGDLFLWLIDTWRGFLLNAQPHLPLLIRIIGLGGFLGASLSISLMSDLLSLLNFHLHVFYTAAARIYSWQLTILISLFHLFRGKKRNVLRDRIDSCDYELDQLLLGTILFTLLAFLFPTVIVFYLTFAAFRIVFKFSKTGLNMVLAFLVQFPLFALLLRIKDAKRLPGGIRFTLLNHPTNKEENGNAWDKSIVSLLYIESKPLPLDLMFQSLVNRQSSIMGSTLRLSTLLEDICTGKL